MSGLGKDEPDSPEPADKDSKVSSKLQQRSIRHNKNSIFSHSKVHNEIDKCRRRLEMDILVDNYQNYAQDKIMELCKKDLEQTTPYREDFKF